MKPINLQPFAENGADSMRYHLFGTPFVQSGYLIATDGRILIRTKSKKSDTKGSYPPVAKVTDRFDWSDCRAITPDDMICDRCLGAIAIRKVIEQNKNQSRNPRIVHLLGLRFNGYYVALILSLPNVKVKIQEDTLVFCSGKYQGLLMPVVYAN